MATALASNIIPPGPARAQSLNLDAAPGPLPPDDHGAAADFSGEWYQLSFPEDGVSQVLSIEGAVSQSVLVTWSGPPIEFGVAGELGPETAAAALLNDFIVIEGDSFIEFDGLADGDYQVYTYAWSPYSDPVQAPIQVMVQVANVAHRSGGAWSGAYVVGRTHTEHEVTVTDGKLVLKLTAPHPARFNGIQLVYRGPAREVEPENAVGCGAAARASNTGLWFTLSLLAAWSTFRRRFPSSSF